LGNCVGEIAVKKDNTIEAFFALLRAGLWGDGNPEIRIDGTTDWNIVYQLAQEQSVLGLVLAGLEHSDIKPPKELLLQWIGEVQIIEQRNKAMNDFLSKLSESLHKEGVDFFLLKGQGVAQCYERPLWRSSGDIDLLLDDDNFFKAQKYLYSIASGYEPLLKEEKHQEFTVGAWIVELHGNQPTHFSRITDSLLESLQEYEFNKGDVREWNNNGASVKLLSPDSDVLFLFTHYLKHFFRGGIGLRQICDWCRLLWTFSEEINKSLLEQRLKQMGLMTEWKAFAALAVYELGYPAEDMLFYVDTKKWKRKSSKVLEFVLKTGNFGHNRAMGYYKQYPYLVTKVISFYWRVADNVRYLFIFPVDSFRVFGWLIRHGIKNL